MAPCATPLTASQRTLLLEQNRQHIAAEEADGW